ncbi:MAG: hypothetical protein AAF639_26810 [Chloroflexota bacterium]
MTLYSLPTWYHLSLQKAQYPSASFTLTTCHRSAIACQELKKCYPICRLLLHTTQQLSEKQTMTGFGFPQRYYDYVVVMGEHSPIFAKIDLYDTRFADRCQPPIFVSWWSPRKIVTAFLILDEVNLQQSQ